MEDKELPIHASTHEAIHSYTHIEFSDQARGGAFVGLAHPTSPTPD